MNIQNLDRSTVKEPLRKVKFFQFGEGNFLRAFVDWQIDIANGKGILDAGVAIVSPQFKHNNVIDILKKQDGLYHVVLEGVENGQPRRVIRLIKSVQDVFSPREEYSKYEEYINSSDLRFVISNTTEAGIRYEEDDILSAFPVTFPGKVTNFLYKRYKHFNGDPSKGLIFLCCELIEDNGKKLHEYVIKHAQKACLGNDFIDWVNNACIFCDTLVDRIVPGYPHDSINEIKEEIHFDDNAVDKGELYHLWVIGGKDYEKVKHELPLHKAGLHVEFLPSVQSFRDKKVRILNGSHTGMVAISLLLGMQTVLEAFQNEKVNKFIRLMMDKEVLPMINEDPEQLQKFTESILERFYNPYVKHMLSSIALNSLSKWEARNYPTVKDNFEKKGVLADFQIFTFAALMALYAPDSGFSPNDTEAHIAYIRSNWNDQDLTSTIKNILRHNIFTTDFDKEVPGFAERAAQYVADIRSKGIEEALDLFLTNH